MADDEPPLPIFKKVSRNKNVRARTIQPEDEPTDSSSAVSRVSKVAKPSPFVSSSVKPSGSSELRKDLAQPSDRRISNFDNKATATNEQETERDRDAQAQFERAQAAWADEGGDTLADGRKVYRGAAGYRQYTGKAENFDSQVLNGHGPARAPVHYRATSRFDYQPDICKDFKDTGYCGYGDACKFLHDRSDYKSGWQLEQQWEEARTTLLSSPSSFSSLFLLSMIHSPLSPLFSLLLVTEEKKRRHEAALIAAGEMEDPSKRAAADTLPFACLICREPWHAKSRPVVTKCDHYFCEACALQMCYRNDPFTSLPQHASKTRRCFVCSEQTHGIFNSAKAIQEKIDEREALKEAQSADKEQSEEKGIQKKSALAGKRRGQDERTKKLNETSTLNSKKDEDDERGCHAVGERGLARARGAQRGMSEIPKRRDDTPAQLTTEPAEPQSRGDRHTHMRMGTRDFFVPPMQVVFKQQRVRERDRRERQKVERAQREREQREQREIEAELSLSLQSGELRERVVARVLTALKTEEAQRTIGMRAEERIEARRKELLAQVQKERDDAVTSARKQEEERLSRQQELQNILKENASKVAAEAKKREEEEKHAKREREAELLRIREERKRLRAQFAFGDASEDGVLAGERSIALAFYCRVQLLISSLGVTFRTSSLLSSFDGLNACRKLNLKIGFGQVG
ncbi:MAG: hypothetical protein SGPRY_004339 [Prymnesium sp.]